MAHKTSSPGTVLNTLQRGKACLRCRKRKMRCDGVKPACQQCSRARKADCCEYDDGKGKTRTQILRETIARLEQRIQDLEDPDHVARPIVLHDPTSHQYAASPSSSVTGSPGATNFYSSHSPLHSDSASSPPDCWAHLPVASPSPAPAPFADLLRFEDPQPPFELSQMLLDIFAAHRHQFGLEINMGRLVESLTLPTSEQRHPALLNAIFLWSCCLSRPGPLSQYETHYLTRALDSLTDALRQPDKMVDVVQASCLLSLYYFSNGRMLEGSYHASAAAALVAQFGLEMGASAQQTFDSLHAIRIESAHDPIEQTERILAFWQAYNLDYCWSVVLRKPPVIRDGRYAFTSLTPSFSEDYELVEGSHLFQTCRPFVEASPVSVSNGHSTLALRSKASALFQRADRLSSSLVSHATPSNALREDIQMLEHAISRLQATIIPPHQFDSIPCDKHSLVVIHTLTHAATILLYSRFSQDDPVSYDKCLSSARSIVTLIKHHALDADLAFLDPIVSCCWTSAAEVFLRELETADAAWPLVDSTEIRNEITTIVYAMTTLATQFPLFGLYAARIQDRLSEL